jgi:hypothetical protein
VVIAKRLACIHSHITDSVAGFIDSPEVTSSSKF